MKSKAYRALPVNQVEPGKVGQERPGQRLVVGVDMGKFVAVLMARWDDGTCERPWRMANPSDIPTTVALLQRLRQDRPLLVAVEPSGTYGDALRQALHDAGIAVQRVSPKAAHDYAEIFDGVPSQHDGKDAGVVAELAAQGKAVAWPYEPPSAWEQELRYQVQRLSAQRRVYQLWLGQLEGLLGRHWPEATRVLKLSSGTLLGILARQGGPAELVAAGVAPGQLRVGRGSFLRAEQVEALLASARDTVGVRLGEWERRQVQQCAEQALAARRAYQRSGRALRRLAQGQPTLQAQGQVVGVTTACVLWADLGDPHDYFCAAAYRKAMGLNLAERSSGTYQGQLHMSKRGSARVRQWLYFAALRCVQQAGVRDWYQAKKAKQDGSALRAVVAVMRKLALAAHHVGVHGGNFEARRLFGAVSLPQAAASASAQGCGQQRR